MGVQVKLSSKVRDPLTNQVKDKVLFLGLVKYEDGIDLGFDYPQHTFPDRETAYRAVIDYFDRYDTLDGIKAFFAGMGENLEIID